MVVSVGLRFKKNPNATPAKETWESVSAISDCLLITKNTPSIGAIPAMKIAARKALLMNSYESNAIENPPFSPVGSVCPHTV